MFRLAFVLASLCASLAHAAPVTFKAADGATLSGDLAGKGERGVVLVHGAGGSQAEWAPLVKRLENIQSLAVDLRGHGASKGDPDPLASIGDVAGAIAFLRARGVKKITLVGAGLGGNLALAAAGDDPSVEGVVMLSPQLNASGVKASASLAKLGERPLLLVAGADDALALKASELISNSAPSAKVQVVANGGSGIAMLNRASELEGSLVAWIQGAFAVSEGDLSPQVKMNTEVKDIQTTGKRIGE